MRKYIIPLLFLFLLSGCVSNSVIKDIDTVQSNQKQNSNVSIKDSNEPVKQNYDLTVLNIKLPANWHLDTKVKEQYYFVDDKGENKGWVIVDKYQDNNAFSEWKPNHSEITYDEFIDIPLGKCRLFTLDADNGTAASGITGTHNDYYAIIPVKDNIRYILEFSQNDKKPQAKEQFIEILKNLSFK